MGKTYLASALIHAACMRGYSALYRRLPDLLRETTEAHGKEGLEAYLEGLGKVDLMVVDDWGLETLDHQQSLDLLEIVQARDGVKSTLVASCVPPAQWASLMHNPTVGEAFTDRLVHNAHQINLQGDSLRGEYSSLREGGAE